MCAALPGEARRNEIRSGRDWDSPQPITITIPTTLPTALGPILIGLVLNWFLFGILSNQLYVYYLCFPKDSRYLKVLVYGLYMLEKVQACVLTNDCFNWFILSWGHPDELLLYHLEWLNVPIFDGKNWMICALIVVLALLQFSGALATGIQLKMLPSFTQIGQIFAAINVWLSATAGVDIVIAASMIFLLTRNRSRFSNTQVLISKLVRLSIETGSATAFVAIVDLTLYNIFPDTNLHTTPASVLAKFYSNTLMVVLNNRLYIQRKVPGSVYKGGNASGGSTSQQEAREAYSKRFKDALRQASHPSQVTSNGTISGASYGGLGSTTDNFARVTGRGGQESFQLKSFEYFLPEMKGNDERDRDRKPGPVVWIDTEELSV
ncbi:hypothetical protein M422DRAFT_245819 [Sphaerobolus stellatus SS14]|nr:hypothetical protein M422DRAFT_245819 [Sphaerobolus stellatus SS14]